MYMHLFTKFPVFIMYSDYQTVYESSWKTICRLTIEDFEKRFLHGFQGVLKLDLKIYYDTNEVNIHF